MRHPATDRTVLLILIHEGHERTDVEYKRSLAWSGEARYKLIKAVMAFSNYGGGYIVIGYDESQPKPEERLSGVANDDLVTWEVTNVNRDINNHCTPPIDVEVIEVPEEDKDISYVVLRIPSHGTVPHICNKDQNDCNNNLILKKGALYYRSKNKTCEEISEPSDWTDLISRCTLARKEELLRDFQHILSGATVNRVAITERRLGPYEEMDRFRSKAVPLRPQGTDGMMFREIICYLLSEWNSVEVETVKNALSNACIDYRGWPFVFFMPNSKVPPEYGNNVIFVCSNEPFYNSPRFD